VPLRRIAATVLSCAALLTVAGCTKTQERAPAGNGGTATVAVQAGQSTYTAGQPVRLAVTLTNTWNQTCRLTTSAMGGISVLELTRDGSPVAPQITEASFINGFQWAVAGTLVDVEPGKSVRFDFASDDGTFNTYAADARGGAEVSLWPVDTPGRYAMTIAYLRPPLPNVPADPCQVAGASATVNFTVVPS
jgi:hypothetical protein